MATPDQIAAWKLKLGEAENAYHLVQIGQSVEVQQHDGRRLHYTAANVNALSAYIARLRVLIAGNSARGLGRIRYVTPT